MVYITPEWLHHIYHISKVWATTTIRSEVGRRPVFTMVVKILFTSRSINHVIGTKSIVCLCNTLSVVSHCKYSILGICTVYPKKYAHGFVVLCLVVILQSCIMNSHEVFIHIHQGCFAGTGAIFRLPQCQWSKPDGYGKISQCITTTKHSKAKTVCIFLGIYCMYGVNRHPHPTGWRFHNSQDLLIKRWSNWQTYFG